MAKDSKRKKNPQLHFFGQSSSPDRPEKVLDRRFVLGNGKIPSELKTLKSRLSMYTYSQSGKKPNVDIQRIKATKGTAWRVDLKISEERQQVGFALHGKDAIREEPELILRQVNPKTSFNSFRPTWTDATFAPKIIAHDRFRPMKRIKGRPINPLYVFGIDDRWSFRDPSWPWGLIGKVFTSSGWTGSAALIGDRIIATAAHVVPWDDDPWWMRFVPSFYDGTSLHGPGVESYVSNVRGFRNTDNVAGYDWAVCRLYEPLGSWLGYFGYNGFDDDWVGLPYFQILGYPGAIAGGQRPSFQGSISSFDVDGDWFGGIEIETRGDVTPGNSGGPMIGWWKDDPRLVGVVSGEEEDWSPGYWPWDWFDLERGNVVAGGDGFTSLMAWGRSNWPL